jgi:4-amino-4-deoxy-L-arabinose transferase-like glycosyltransferase
LVRRAAVLLLIFALALGVRLAWISYANPSPSDGRFGDEVFYDHAAQALAEGKGYVGFFNQQTANWPPGYPLILAGVYKVVGHRVIAAKALNAVAGAATCLLVYVVGARVFSRRAGLIAALMMAFFPGQIYFSSLVLTESVFPAMLMLLVLLSLMWIVERERPSAARLFVLGVLFGAAALTRNEAAVLIVPALILLKLVLPSWRRFARQGSFLVVGAVLAVMPWTVRNAIVMKGFIPICSGAGHTLLAGHQDDPYNPGHVFPEAKYGVQYAYLPFPERETKIEQAALNEALRYIVHHPREEILVFPFEKFFHLYRDDSTAVDWIRGSWLHISQVPWLKGSWLRSLDDVGAPVVTIQPSTEDKLALLANGYYYVVLLAALLGVAVWLSLRDKKKLLLVLFVAVWTGAHILIIPGSRYHVPIIPILCLWAALPLALAWDRLRPRPSEAAIIVGNGADGTDARQR